ncbi:MAG: hypothetical protein ACERKN_00045 [Velocimicrobium sp.]
MREKKISVGIGFATGRKHFQRVLRSYIYNWKESSLVDNVNVSLNLFVAYDLNYKKTKKTDYTKVSQDISDMLESKHFIGIEEVEEAKRELVDGGVIEENEATAFFGKGYASSRNIVMYYAIKSKMDYVLFLDDDEYPVAVTKNLDTAVWGGQHVLKTHLLNIENADITYGHHCGYISPIPFLEFSEVLPEDSFRLFIQAISNDIVNWENIKGIMKNGGVSYANTEPLTDKKVIEVEEVNHTKFISGSNLCINLSEPNRVFPFYNPPGARGEDTFLSTCLSSRKVLRVPCYTFHDGFSSYNHLLSGVLPIKLKFIKPDSKEIIKRFYNTCIGWVRYKPLLLYITNRESYQDKINEMTQELDETLPQICQYFDTQDFLNIAKELKKYDKNVKKHYEDFEEYKRIWSKIMGIF